MRIKHVEGPLNDVLGKKKKKKAGGGGGGGGGEGEGECAGGIKSRRYINSIKYLSANWLTGV